MIEFLQHKLQEWHKKVIEICRFSRSEEEEYADRTSREQ